MSVFLLVIAVGIHRRPHARLHDLARCERNEAENLSPVGRARMIEPRGRRHVGNASEERPDQKSRRDHQPADDQQPSPRRDHFHRFVQLVFTAQLGKHVFSIDGIHGFSFSRASIRYPRMYRAFSSSYRSSAVSGRRPSLAHSPEKLMPSGSSFRAVSRT